MPSSTSAKITVWGCRPPQGQCQQQRDHQRDGGELQVLEHPLHDQAAVVGDEIEDAAHQRATPAVRRVQGAIRRWTLSRSRSATTARAMASTAPSSTSVMKNFRRPSVMKVPRLSTPIVAAIVTRPMVVTVATRSPATITG